MASKKTKGPKHDYQNQLSSHMPWKKNLSFNNNYMILGLYISLYNNTHSNAIVNTVSYISYNPLLDAGDTDRCLRTMFLQFFLWTF
jgi:hypothetical protein